MACATQLSQPPTSPHTPVPAPPAPPPAPAPSPPPPPGQAAAPAGDPHGFGNAVARLAPTGRGAAGVAITVAAATLETGERVEALAVGRLEGAPAAAVLTDRRLVLANQREWNPTVASFGVNGALSVQGWEDAQGATMVFTATGRTITFDGVIDKQPAYDLVHRVRARSSS